MVYSQNCRRNYEDAITEIQQICSNIGMKDTLVRAVLEIDNPGNTINNQQNAINHHQINLLLPMYNYGKTTKATLMNQNDPRVNPTETSKDLTETPQDPEVPINLVAMPTAPSP